jgi:probable rRNA maturation factor
MNTRRSPSNRSSSDRNTTEVIVRNLQRRYPISTPILARITQCFLLDLNRSGEIGIYVIGPRTMAALNWRHLQHEGSTDILTFDHGSTAHHLYGELYISPQDAEAFAVEYKTSWREEVIRYILHGLLHLCGYTDEEPDARRKMKRVENQRFERWKQRVQAPLQVRWPTLEELHLLATATNPASARRRIRSTLAKPLQPIAPPTKASRGTIPPS